MDMTTIIERFYCTITIKSPCQTENWDDKWQTFEKKSCNMTYKKKRITKQDVGIQRWQHYK